MSELPTLIVESSAIIHGIQMSGHDPVVRVDGPLPTVLYFDDPAERPYGPILSRRPLRVGDRVTLATTCAVCDGDGDLAEPEGDCVACYANGTLAFAAATVARIEGPFGYPRELWHRVTVTDLEAL